MREFYVFVMNNLSTNVFVRAYPADNAEEAISIANRAYEHTLCSVIYRKDGTVMYSTIKSPEVERLLN